MKKVYLVEDHGNSPGRVYAVMVDEKDALWFAEQLETKFKLDGEKDPAVGVIERVLWYGQPCVLGVNE